jgi:hypothetical protein
MKQCASDFSFQVGHFTLDNAANNRMMMQHLEMMLRFRDIDFDAADRKIMCDEPGFATPST